MGKGMAVVLRHPTEGNPPLPIAEMVTSDHSAPNIRTFLERFKRDESKVFNGRVGHSTTTKHGLFQSNNSSWTSRI